MRTFDLTSNEDRAYRAELLEGYVTGNPISMSYYN